jgi:RNA polymerase sigma-70 factor, ECF subfamily
MRLMIAFARLAPVYSMPSAFSGKTIQPASATRGGGVALERFLASVELKAFKMAQLALRHEDDALDAVQDAMLQLARSYASRSIEEWKPLFYRILQNRIRDLQRRRTVRARFLSWLPASSTEPDEGDDPIARSADSRPEPGRRLELDEAMHALEHALQELPQRQQQAFLLRNLEGLDVEQTATAMSCSQGSVKTHYFRALQTLRAKLGDFYDHNE